MLLTKLTKLFFPHRLLWRLTFINVIVVGSFIVISSWMIYDTACFLVDGMGSLNGQKQHQFDSTLFQYLWIVSIIAITVGSLIHFYLIKKLIHPLKDLTESTKRMKAGQYPPPIEVNSKDEMGQLIGHFNGLIEQLKNSEQHKKDLVTDLSHEIRTPLSNLNGYMSALKNGVVKGDKVIYESLHGELKRLINMVEQLDQLNEWDYISKQTYSEKEPMDMQKLVEQSIEMFRWSIKEANMTLEIFTDSGIVHVYHGGIEQVISNLLDNAIRHYEGTGSITIKGEKLQKTYQFSITGPGQAIPKEARRDIFDRFYRADPSRARTHQGGTGLGLAISKEIIEHHQGEIGVESKGNQHTFWFTLPLHANEQSTY